MSISIERAKADDILAIHAINLECLPENYKVDYIAQHLLTYPSLCWVARVAQQSGTDKVVGYLLGSLRGDGSALIVSIAVQRKYRGLGAARSMIEQMLGAAKQIPGCKKSRLHVRENNVVARRLYESFGYLDVDYSSKFYPDTMGYEMELLLL